VKGLRLYIITSSQLVKYGGGTDTWLSYFIPGIVNTFDEIQILAVEFDGAREELQKFDFSNVKIVRLCKPSYVDMLSKYSTYLTENIKSGDILLSVGTGFQGLVGSMVKKVYRESIIHITWSRGIPHREIIERRGTLGSLVMKQVEKRTFLSSNGVIFNGNDTYNYYHSKFQSYLPKNTVVIPNALRNDSYFQNPDPSFSSPLTIGYYGRFVKTRGFDYFVELSKSQILKGRYRFCAWGWPEDEINKSPIKYMGKYNNDDFEVYIGSDIVAFFLPTRGTFGGGVSHSLLEAMASGRVILGWDNQILRNVVDEKCAYLVPQGNLASTEKKLLDIYARKDDLIEKSYAARQKARNYTAERHVSMFIDFINRVY